MRIDVVHGDITTQAVDAIGNAANSSLLGGGGVDGAIHRAGGPTILAECRELRASRLGKGLPTGHAVATTAGNLPARWVIHTVGPVYSATEDRSELLASCYRESLRVADEIGARTVAFPAVSAGRYGWPIKENAKVAVSAVHSARTRVAEVRFVLIDSDVYSAFRDANVTLGATDGQIVTDLLARPEETWLELFAIADGLTDADREVRWGGGNEMKPGVTQMPFPIYSRAINRIRALLPMAVFGWPTWIRDNPLFPEGRGLDQAPVADAVRLATAYIRGERFSDGAIGNAITNGALTAIIERLRAWWETERAAALADGSPDRQ